jgi:hypothetical protein
MSGRYKPLKANATIIEGALPEQYREYAKPKVRTPNEIRVEGLLKARLEKAERAETEKKAPKVKQAKKVVRATMASDKVTRTDRLQGAIDFIESEDGPKGRTKALLLGQKSIFNEKIHTPTMVGDEEVPNLLGTFADKQKETEENPGQYALDKTSLGTEVYMPSTRTGFYKFIQDTYNKRFSISSTRKEMDPEACEKLLQTGEQGVTAFLFTASQSLSRASGVSRSRVRQNLFCDCGS